MARPLRAKYQLSSTATFNANTGVNSTTEYITTTSAHGFANDTLVEYRVAAGNTALTGLTANSLYYVVGANSTALQLAATKGGSAINVTAMPTSETGHTLSSLSASVAVGVQEMSDADLNDFVAPLVLTNVTTNPSKIGRAHV